MVRPRLAFSAILGISGFLTGAAEADDARPESPPISKESKACIECHEQATPGIVADWRASRHAKITVEEALKKAPLEQRVSSPAIPEALRAVAVGCFECHGLNPTAHKDAFRHETFTISVVVSPNDCKTCHAVEVDEYASSKRAHARGNLEGNPIFHGLAESVNGVQELRDGKLVTLPASDMTRSESCLGCHGSEIVVRGTKTVKSDYGDYVVPDLANWPNHGVGRVNPDGSLGACASPCIVAISSRVSRRGVDRGRPIVSDRRAGELSTQSSTSGPRLGCARRMEDPHIHIVTMKGSPMRPIAPSRRAAESQAFAPSDPNPSEAGRAAGPARDGAPRRSWAT